MVFRVLPRSDEAAKPLCEMAYLKQARMIYIISILPWLIILCFPAGSHYNTALIIFTIWGLMTRLLKYKNE